jgi:hypothetical protein
MNAKMNGILLEGEALNVCTKSMSATIDDEASVESIFDDLQHFEEAKKAGRAGDLLCDVAGSVASDAGSEAAMPIVDLFSVKGRCTAASQFTRVVCALIRGL